MTRTAITVPFEKADTPDTLGVTIKGVLGPERIERERRRWKSVTWSKFARGVGSNVFVCVWRST